MKKDINHLIVYLLAVGAAAFSVIQVQKGILPQIAGILVCLYNDLRNGVIEKLLMTVKKTSFGAQFLEDYTFRTILTTMPSFIINVAYTVYNGVIGIANQMMFPPNTAGRRQIRIPLITSPLATEAINAIFGFIKAWK